jgi:hypothetical protein
MPFVFKNLIKQEVHDLNEALRDGLLEEEWGAEEFVDPTPKYMQILDIFNEWFCLGRSPTLRTSEVEHLAALGQRLQLTLKETFPDKTGDCMQLRWMVAHLHEWPSMNMNVHEWCLMFITWRQVPSRDGSSPSSTPFGTFHG